MKACGDSMNPILKDGDIYEVKQTEEPNEGDIILFYEKNLKKYVCHRVIRVIQMKNGERYYKTKGDNNLEADPFSVKTESIIGIIIHS